MQLKNLMSARPFPRKAELNAKIKLHAAVKFTSIRCQNTAAEKKSNIVLSRQYKASGNSLKILINDAFRIRSIVTKQLFARKNKKKPQYRNYREYV